MLTSTIGSSGLTVQNSVQCMLKRPYIFYNHWGGHLKPSHVMKFLGLHFNLEQALISPPSSFLETLTSILSLLSTSSIMPARKITSINSSLALCSFHSPQTTSAAFSPVLDKTRLAATCSTMGQSNPTEPWIYFTSPLVLQAGSTTGSSWLELVAGCLAIVIGARTGFNKQSMCIATTVLYSQAGGTHYLTLFHKTVELFPLLSKLAIILAPTHLPGAHNVTMDALSQLDSPSPMEWHLLLGTFNSLFSAFWTPLMDMFVTTENKVTPIYVSPYPADRAWAVDTLPISWDDLGLIYAFPPAPIVPKTLERIKTYQRMIVILILSQHPSQPWHPLLLQLSVQPRIPLPDMEWIDPVHSKPPSASVPQRPTPVGHVAVLQGHPPMT